MASRPIKPLGYIVTFFSGFFGILNYFLSQFRNKNKFTFSILF